MQEVVKRMQEKQEKLNQPKPPEHVTLTITEHGCRNYPVIMPKFSSVHVGDLVWFKLDESTVCGNAVFVEPYCSVDDDLWTLAIKATGNIPIKAIRYAVISDVDWTKKEESK